MADYLVQEEDGTSHLTLEEDDGDLLLEDGNPPIAVPFIAATTTLFAPSLGDHADARVSQLPVEVVVQGVSSARISQLPVEAVIRSTAALVRLSQLPVEAVVQNTEETVTVAFIYWTVSN